MTLKIIFLGTPENAVPSLKSIANSSHKILEVYTQPAKKKNRGQKVQNSPIHNFANDLNIPVRCPVSFEGSEEIEHIQKLKPDFVVVVAYGKILPSQLLNLKNTTFLNVFNCHLFVYSLIELDNIIPGISLFWKDICLSVEPEQRKVFLDFTLHKI